MTGNETEHNMTCSLRPSDTNFDVASSPCLHEVITKNGTTICMEKYCPSGMYYSANVTVTMGQDFKYANRTSDDCIMMNQTKEEFYCHLRDSNSTKCLKATCKETGKSLDYDDQKCKGCDNCMRGACFNPEWEEKDSNRPSSWCAVCEEGFITNPETGECHDVAGKQCLKGEFYIREISKSNSTANSTDNEECEIYYNCDKCQPGLIPYPTGEGCLDCSATGTEYGYLDGEYGCSKCEALNK